MSFGKIMSIFKCKGCGHKYEADVQTLAPRYHNCPKCGTENGSNENTHLDKDGWETP